MEIDNPRFIKKDDWIFETKSVRAIKVSEYGKPYTAIANITISCDTMYIDGMLNEKNGVSFTKKDFICFIKYCELVGINTIWYHRYHNGKLEMKSIEIDLKK